MVQIRDRRGSIELSLPPGEPHDDAPPSLIWRVPLLDLAPGHLLVEQPTLAGEPIPVSPGQRFVGVMSIGQNRWMFETRALEPVGARANPGARADTLRIAMPQRVERCQRRNFYRVSIAQLNLPDVACWPLLDPTSVILAQAACVAEATSADEHEFPNDADSITLPDVGPRFQAKLMNIGGGGAGLLVARENARPFDSHRAFWLRIDLRPSLPTPLGVAVKLCHTRIDAAQNVYAGVAFDFTFNADYQRFVVDRICRFVDDHRTRSRSAA